MSNKKTIVIVGATSAMAEHCARLWVVNPVNLFLVGRDKARLQRVALDLKVRSPQSEIKTIESNLIDVQAIEETIELIVSEGRVDIALIAHGSLVDQSECNTNLNTCYSTLEVNALSPALYAEAFAKVMEKNNFGTIALIGSVAGDRGRKSNYTYGAAKGLVTRYAQGLQHRFAGTGVKVVLIKPGPTDTPMTSKFKDSGMKLAPVQDVAKQIVKGIDIGATVVYAPRKWRLIMMIIRHLPLVIFNKMNI